MNQDAPLAPPAEQVSPRPLRRRSRRPRWRLAVVVVVLALGAGAGWLLTQRSDKQPERADAPKPPPVMELAAADTLQVSTQALTLRLPISGSLTPLVQATVRAKVGGEVLATPVSEGMPVARGQVVVRLDSGDLAARLATQQAAQDDAAARLALARKNQQSNLALLKQKFISQNAVDTAQNSVELAQAAVKSAASQREIAQRALGDALVRAPIAGILSKRMVQPGEKAAPEMPLFAIVDLRQMVLEAQVPASEIPQVQPGQMVDFSVEGFSGRSFQGRVTRINPAAEAGTRSLIVYISVDNADAALRSGMFAKGGIVLRTAAPLPVIPLAAVRSQNGVPVVWRVAGGVVTAQPVTLGVRNDSDGMVQVERGIAAGDRIIVARLENVKPGSQVRLPAVPAVPAAGIKG